jgi:hypothetical protein
MTKLINKIYVKTVGEMQNYQQSTLAILCTCSFGIHLFTHGFHNGNQKSKIGGIILLVANLNKSPIFTNNREYSLNQGHLRRRGVINTGEKFLGEPSLPWRGHIYVKSVGFSEF